MEEMGLDGHWLIAAVIEEIPKQLVDPTAPGAIFNDQMTEMLFYLDAELFNKIQAGYVAEGFDDDLLMKLDGWLEEYMPELLSASEKILRETYHLIGQYSSPPHCRCRTVDKYLLGYSVQDRKTGCLTFEFKDHENRHTLRC